MNKGHKNLNSDTKVRCDSNTSEDFLRNAEALTKMQEEIDIRSKAMKNYEQLPVYIKKRVRALKKLQLDVIGIEEKFFKELNQLEEKFSEQYQIVHDKRNEIVSGVREPTDAEGDYKSENESDDVEELVESVNTNMIMNVTDESGEHHDTSFIKGIPEFWLKVLEYSDIVREIIHENDVPILRHLSDVKCVMKSGDDEHGFVLEFFFSPNEFFTDQKLTKEYFVHINASKSSPLSYEGPEIVRTKGCHINWCPGKNVTVKLVKKVQKGKKRTATKTVKTDSFFNFFDPPTASMNGEDDLSPELENILETDFEIGQYFRERLIPRAVLYYTGETINDDFDEMDDDEDDEDEEEDGDNGGEEVTYANGAQKARQSAQDCKQQ